MAVERKTKSRRKMDEVQEKPSKEEYAVAKFLRFGVPTRQGRLVGMTVQCFFANKAVDALLESKWSKQAKEPLFTNRSSCVAFCNRLLQKGLFHRAEKVQRSKDRDKTKKKKKLKEGEKDEESNEETVRERKKKEKKGKKDGDTEKEEKKEEVEKKEEGDKKEEKKPEKEEEKKKKERKLKLNMHDDQRFVDGDEVYVWIYDPVPLKTFLIGLLMVFGATALCLFPLWPEEVRIGVYYLSLAAAGFVGFILSLVVVRLILFCLVWVVSFGKHHFWFLPNLTEDVGFFDSFKPLYKHDYFGKESNPDKEEEKQDKELTGKDKEEKVGPGEAKKEEIEKDENSGSDKSENGEFELVDKDELTGEEIAGNEEVQEENDDEIDDEDNDFDDEDDSEDENTEGKKDK
ncbi:translocation protein SEC62-like isoform X1 [Haliotis rufescens]|uniref:translocation protein SEC62-like isoform X1 n=1 Tax=Haliotis rufescens TaxID=6454 RepID=UPI00201E7B6F|nr:translocation protein SEC62-like isoform X1 [Haliotis rufescens]